MFGQLGYLIAESFRGWKQQRTVILPSLVTIFLCSLLLISSLVAFRGVLRILQTEKTLYTIEAFLPSEIHMDSVSVIKKELERLKHVEKVDFVSAESALVDFKRHFDGEMLELVDENPIPPFFRVKLKETSSNFPELVNVRNEIIRTELFDEVQAPIEWVEKISAWKFKLIFWPICICVLLLITLSLIISNSVRLSLLNRKLLVENMKYAGGSFGFIEFPFVLEGFMQGFVGSTFASLTFAFIIKSFISVLPMIDTYLHGFSYMLAIVVFIVSALSAYFSFRTVQGFLLVTRNEQVQ